MFNVVVCVYLVFVAGSAAEDAVFSSLPMTETAVAPLKEVATPVNLDCMAKCMTANFGCTAAAFVAMTSTCFMAALQFADFSTAAPGSKVFRKPLAGFSNTYAQVGNRTFRVIQQRSKGDLSFARSWTEYDNGFGDDTDFWLGLTMIHSITGSTPRLLRVEAVTWSGVLYISEFSGFTVGNASINYTMNFGSYLSSSSNTTGDSLTNHRGGMFSTIDRDNDVYASSCSQSLCGGGGWWYKACSDSNPNGLYYTSAVLNSEHPMYWYYAGNTRAALKSIRLMLLV